METLGYETTETLALTCPPYILAAIVAIAASYFSGRFNERTWHITVLKTIVIVGFVLPAVTFNLPVRLFGIFLFVGCSFGINNLILGWGSATLGQTNEKKAISLAMMNTTGGLASIYTPYLWPKTDGPRYLTAWMASIAWSIGVVVLAVFMKWSLKRRNRKMRENNPEETNFYVY